MLPGIDRPARDGDDEVVGRLLLERAVAPAPPHLARGEAVEDRLDVRAPAHEADPPPVLLGRAERRPVPDAGLAEAQAGAILAVHLLEHVVVAPRQREPLLEPRRRRQ